MRRLVEWVVIGFMILMLMTAASILVGVAVWMWKVLLP